MLRKIICIFSKCLAAIIILWAVHADAKEILKPDKILQSIEKAAGAEMATWCKQAKTNYPPDVVLLRIFKKEHELEIWAKNNGMNQMVLIKVLPVCAMDFEPGPKLKAGDSKTPEGFYYPVFGYESTNWWMWIDIDKQDERGQVGKGSCFKMCIEYPNALDRLRTKAAGFSNPGSSICIHGNCISIGCASLMNKDFLAVFAFSRHHNTKKYGKLQVHIFPFRFDKVQNWEPEALQFKHYQQFSQDKLFRFWDNLKEGFDLFNKIRNPLNIIPDEHIIIVNGKPIKEYKYLIRD